ncbi:MAG TPA: T9SS type A sorting domain-containing protein [Candidatus Cloacimonadota bacterium]|nr:T9SS type A sorting domain-containing protein [Candidatus Cloacimonadota bacterium]
MKKMSLLLVFVAILMIRLGAQIAHLPSGSGTSTSPYMIQTLNNLYWVAADSSRWHANYLQTANIDAAQTSGWFSGQGWLPIGAYRNRFNGHYNGGGHSIQNLHVNRESGTALFYFIEDAIIQNIHLENAYVTGQGSLLVYNSIDSQILNCTVSGILTGGGGLLTESCWGTLIDNCTVSGTMSGVQGYSGAISGSLYDTHITNSTVDVIINSPAGQDEGFTNIGGMVGDMNANSSITYCYAKYQINSGFCSNVGGLVGSFSGTITNSYCEGSITGSGAFLGPMVGAMGPIPWYELMGAYYNILSCTINQSHVIGIGALNEILFNQWLSSGRNLNIDDFLSSEDGIYLVRGSQDFDYLMAFAQYPDYSFKLTEDLDMSGLHGYNIPYLGSNLDGNGYSVLNLALETELANPLGFIGWAKSVLIKDLSVVNCHISGGIYTGALLGYSRYQNQISNCYASGLISASGFPIRYPSFGGLIGVLQHSAMDSCRSEVDITVSNLASYIGGLVGYTSYSDLNNSSCEASVRFFGSPTNVGPYTGGLTGYLELGYIIGCFADAQVIGANATGGLAGKCYGIIRNSYSSGNVQGINYVGGLVGILEGAGQWDPEINSSCSTATVTGINAVGGLVGKSYGLIENTFARGAVNGLDSVGGLVGDVAHGYQVYGVVFNSYSTGYVTGTGEHVGGLTGNGSGPYNGQCYWDRESSGQSTSTFGSGRSTDQMTHPYSPDTFVGWDFDNIWCHDPNYSINDGYPCIRLTFPGTPNLDPIISEEKLKLTIYPNPARVLPTFSFNLSRRGNNDIQIFNLRGQLVRSIDLSTKQKGDHIFTWDRKDQSGRALGSGLYFIRLRSGKQCQTVRIVLY